MKTKKPTRRWIVRRLVYGMLREYARHELEQTKFEYDSSGYRSAGLRAEWAYGGAHGAIKVAEELGVIGMSESWRLQNRRSRVMDAVHKRARKMREARRHDC